MSCNKNQKRKKTLTLVKVNAIFKKGAGPVFYLNPITCVQASHAGLLGPSVILMVTVV